MTTEPTSDSRTDRVPAAPSRTELWRRISRWQPLDRWVLGVSGVCVVVLVGLIGWGLFSPPGVQEFSWQQRKIGAWERQMSLTFNRVMDQTSVEENLRIEPRLPYRQIWVGRRLVLTLPQPASYGRTYQLRLAAAQDQQGRQMPGEFTGAFRTPDRQVLTIGVEGETAGRLMLVNLEVNRQILLTAPGLKVTQFYPTRDQETVYYLGTTSTVQKQDLYQLSLSTQTSTRVLDPQTYQNLRLQVSPSGEVVIVERIDPQDPTGTQLWIRHGDTGSFRRLELDTQLAGDFLITPDDQGLLMSQGQGISILSLQEQGEAETFLAQFGQALAIKGDGSEAAMVKFNPDYSRSLWIVSNTGDSQELLTTEGSFLAGEFAPAEPIFYTLVTQRDPEDFTESPQLLALNWETGDRQTLVRAPFPLELDFSLAPDGRSLIYSVLRPSQGVPDPRAPIGPTGQSIAEGQLWWLDLEQPEALAEPLQIPGVGVVWVP